MFSQLVEQGINSTVSDVHKVVSAVDKVSAFRVVVWSSGTVRHYRYTQFTMHAIRQRHYCPHLTMVIRYRHYHYAQVLR